MYRSSFDLDDIPFGIRCYQFHGGLQAITILDHKLNHDAHTAKGGRIHIDNLLFGKNNLLFMIMIFDIWLWFMCVAQKLLHLLSMLNSFILFPLLHWMFKLVFVMFIGFTLFSERWTDIAFIKWTYKIYACSLLSSQHRHAIYGYLDNLL